MSILDNPKVIESVSFFLYDTVKILLLLFVMVAVVGYFRTFISQEQLKRWMKKRGFLANIVAALFGSVTPFCSCSSIPIFFGFIEAGVPLGVSFSFLVTSPMINEYLVVLMLGFFGLKVTVLYVLSGLVIGIVAGVVLGKMGLEKHLEKNVFAKREVKKYKSWKERAKFGLDEAWSVLKKVWLWIVVGVGVGAVIHNFIPDTTVQNIVGAAGFFAVPLAIILGVPLYGNCVAIVPIAVVLFQKGVPLGTALAFMMAVASLSLPEAIILRRVMKLKLIAIFFGIVALGILVIGYLFNVIG
ncbi:permease [Nanoarchaeota archaeon]